MYLLILCAAAIGCETSAERTAEIERLAAEMDGAAKTRDAEDRAAEKSAAEKRAAAEIDAAVDEAAAKEKAFEEKKALQKKSVANSYVKIKVEVELQGVLACTDEAANIAINKKDEWVWEAPGFREGDPSAGIPIGKKKEKWVWVLDFGEDKEMRAKARALDGKAVLVEGSAILRGIQSDTERKFEIWVTKSFLDLEPKVAVKRLVAATKE
jgi:hypothetical protein